MNESEAGRVASRGPSWTAELPALACLVLLATAFVGALELREPRYFLRDDNAAYFLPVYVHTAGTLFDRGELALLNHHQYLGQTHLASGQTGVLYPPVYVAYALAGATGDVRHALFLLALGHFVLGAVGFFVLARTWSVPRWPAAWSALLWLTLPFLAVVSRDWIWIAYGAAWVPWCLVFLDAWLVRGMRWGLVGYAVAKALFCFQGYAQYVILSVLFEAVFVSLHGIVHGVAGGSLPARSWWRRILGWFLVLAATGGLAAPLLLPMWRAKQASQARAGGLGLEEFLSNPLDPGVFLRSQVFDMADPAIHRATGAIFYLGLPVLLLVLGGLFWLLRRGERPGQARRAMVLAAASATALLLSTEAVRLLHPVPLLGSFRWPFKSFFWVLLFAALAAAVVLGELWQRGGRSAALAVAALTLGLVGNVATISWDDWDRPFGPNRMQRSPDELRAFLNRHIDPAAGRVVALWMSHGQDDIERFLTHDYATAAGAFSLGGYDPLVAQTNFDLAKGLEYSNIWRYELTRDAVDYLSEWSVRWLLMPDKPRNRVLVGQFPQLRVASGDDGWLAVENSAAAPFAFLLPADGGPPLPLEVDFGGSGLTVDLAPAAGKGGSLHLQIAPLDDLVAFADGESLGPVGVDRDRHVAVDVPAGAERIVVEYRATAFRTGLAVALSTVLVSVWWWRRAPTRVDFSTG